MDIQQVFYFSGVIAFTITAILMFVLTIGTLNAIKKSRSILTKVEEGLDSKIASSIMQLIPVATSLFMEIKNYKRKKR